MGYGVSAALTVRELLMNDTDLVRLEVDGALARITLARQQAGNAINLAFSQALLAAARSCAANPAIRAVLLRAEGRAFCVGGDLTELDAVGDRRPEHIQRLATDFHAAQATLMTLRAPVVVAVQGAAAGAGLGLAMCGDLILAGASAHFTSAYTAIGLSADGGSTYLLPRLIGLRRTQAFLLTNQRLSAETALDWGLVSAVSADNRLAADSEALALVLSSGPTQAIGGIKRLLSETLSRTFVAQTDAETLEIARLSSTPDACEGIAAFRAKRPPAFEGGVAPSDAAAVTQQSA